MSQKSNTDTGCPKVSDTVHCNVKYNSTIFRQARKLDFCKIFRQINLHAYLRCFHGIFVKHSLCGNHHGILLPRICKNSVKLIFLLMNQTSLFWNWFDEKKRKKIAWQQGSRSEFHVFYTSHWFQDFSQFIVNWFNWCCLLLVCYKFKIRK